MSTGSGLAWFGFWVFISVAFYVAHVQYLAGHDTFFFTHKTEAERALRDKAAGPDGSRPPPPAPPPPRDVRGRGHKP